MIVRDILTPQALAMLTTIADEGSLAAAARAMNLVPSALTYRVRQIEDALDVLLFDRSARKVVLTEAGQELINEGARILADLDAIANRVKRVATGWESQITIAYDSLISHRVMLELCERFFALDPPTQLKLTSHTLTGTWESLAFGECDLAIGGIVDQSRVAGIQSKPLGDVAFVFAVAPHHPLANAAEPLRDEIIQQYRAIAVADSATRSQPITVGLLSGQRVMTVPTMQLKLEAQLRGLGCGFLPECAAAPLLKSGRLVVKRTQRTARISKVSYAWHTSRRAARTGNQLGNALTWWLKQLENQKTRHALLFEHSG